MNDWFPVAESEPIIVKDALIGVLDRNELTDEQVSWWRLTPLGKSASKVHPSGYWFNFVKLDPDKVCGTIPKASGNAKMCYWDKPSGLSVKGYKRIGAFPDEYKFLGNYGNDKERIGNSVPPLLMRSIARNIKSMLQTGQPYRINGKSGFSKIDYPAILATAWQQHLAPKAEDAPTVISTFAGCGGSSLGYSMAGFRELLAVEWDDNAVETFKLNFPDVPVYHGDIAKLSVDECLKMTGLEPGQLDVFDGSPPCQGFSTAGKRNFNDDRNQLFREYVRLLRGLQPKVFVMENVSGMVKGKMKLIFADILRELKASGYRVSARLLNAMYFHVPQSRERMIFIGVREDLGIEPSYPRAESSPVVVRDAFAGIEKLPGPTPTAGTKIAECCWGMRQGETASDFYKKNWGFNLFRLAWDKPSPTFTKGGGACGLIHPELPRKCVKEEYQAVMSFPRQYKFIGTEDDARARLGNSVPPLLMRSVAQHIRQSILTNTQPVRVEA